MQNSTEMQRMRGGERARLSRWIVRWRTGRIGRGGCGGGRGRARTFQYAGISSAQKREAELRREVRGLGALCSVEGVTRRPKEKEKLCVCGVRAGSSC